ncbi:MAG: hypothetical protein ACO3YY_02370 [Phycisphaerales bacterium]
MTTNMDRRTAHQRRIRGVATRTLPWMVLAISTTALAQSPAMEPPPIDPALEQALDAPWLDEEERRNLRVNHGLRQEGDLDTPLQRARAALDEWRLLDEVFEDASVPVDMRAEAAMRRGEFERALELLPTADSSRSLWIRSECLARLGRFDELDRDAADLPAPNESLDSAETISDLVRALVVRSRIAPGTSERHEILMGLLARARGELDRLDWRSRLAEAELLLEKDNPEEAGEALAETLALHPRLADAWALLGRTSIDRFDFARANAAAAALRQLDPEHPLAALLDVREALVRNDPDAARVRLDGVLARYPDLPEALSLEVAVDAARYDFDAMRGRLAALDERWPNHPGAWLEAGRQLALDRQYPEAAELLAEAARRRPEWPVPRIDLAMLELQSGRDAIALAELREIARLDPYNRRAANGLALLEDLSAYERIRTEHFEIRFVEGIDRAVVELMPEALEAMHSEVVARFDHEPPSPTVIEVHPDHPAFAVRITSMPWIHTVAACTGPVIAMEVPRRGPRKKHFGVFDWLEVLRHEYAHTVTLDQTRNRVPHWLTEAAATSVERIPRDHSTCMLLARSLLNGELLPFDEIDWAFVRPKKPTDRALAYAQGRWMLEFMDEAFGPRALIELMERFRTGESPSAAFTDVLGIEPPLFMERFLVWAGDEVRAWGLDPSPSIAELLASARDESAVETDADAAAAEEPETRTSSAVDDEMLATWLSEHPDHPDLLEMTLRRRIGDGALPEELVPMLERYAAARPIDPYPHRVLARTFLEQGEPLRAISHLAALDAAERDDNTYAAELARLERQAGRTDLALAAAMKAVRIDPYDAPLRELAATLAIEAGDTRLARLHLEALLLLEPDRPIHPRRLKAFEQRFGEG